MSVIKIKWDVELIDNVIQNFDVQKVYRSITGASGPWVEITTVPTRVPLVAGQSSYYFDDLTGDESYYYSISYFNSTTLNEGSRSDAIRGDWTGVNYLTRADLERLVGARTVIEYFDDDLSGGIDDNGDFLYSILAAAEAEAASRLLRSWTLDQITLLAQNDRALKAHVAWIALEFASERRPGFAGANGEGAHMLQYDRAIEYCDSLSKAKTRSRGEAVAGIGANTGGQVQPTNDPPFTFTPSRNYPTGHGGF